MSECHVPVQVDLIADFACPWCYLGLVRLERARTPWPITLRWRPFLLNPQLPPEGMDRKSYLSQKFGGREGARRVYERIRQSGRGDGIEFAFERIQRTPNTMKAHRLMLAAERAGFGRAMMHALFRALFEEGRDIGDPGELRAIGREVGLADASCSAALEGDSDEEILRAHLVATRAGIAGVPVFVLNGTHAVAGAQPPEVLQGLIELAAGAGERVLPEG